MGAQRLCFFVARKMEHEEESASTVFLIVVILVIIVVLYALRLDVLIVVLASTIGLGLIWRQGGSPPCEKPKRTMNVIRYHDVPRQTACPRPRYISRTLTDLAEYGDSDYLAAPQRASGDAEDFVRETAKDWVDGENKNRNGIPLTEQPEARAKKRLEWGGRRANPLSVMSESVDEMESAYGQSNPNSQFFLEM
jgi:hypothetical protein